MAVAVFVTSLFCPGPHCVDPSGLESQYVILLCPNLQTGFLSNTNEVFSGKISFFSVVNCLLKCLLLHGMLK